jgi:hypothetical protein
MHRRHAHLLILYAGLLVGVSAALPVFWAPTPVISAPPTTAAATGAGAAGNVSTVASAVVSTTWVTSGGSYICSGPYCVLTVGGGSQITDEDRYAFAALIPFEAQRDRTLRAAFRTWAEALPKGRARDTYLSVLSGYDEADQEKARNLERDKRIAEILKAAPLAECHKIAAVDVAFECKTKAGSPASP